jgi:hypothetical protein
MSQAPPAPLSTRRPHRRRAEGIRIGSARGRRKVGLATMLALGAAAAGGGGKLGPAVLRQGARYLGKTDIAGALGPQVTEIVDTIRGDLLDAGKAAAAAAVTSRLDSLTGSLHERAETLKNPEAAPGKAGETAGAAAGRAGETAARAGSTLDRRGRRRRGAGEEEQAGTGRTRSRMKSPRTGTTKSSPPRTKRRRRRGRRLTRSAKPKRNRSPRRGAAGPPVRLSRGPGDDRHGANRIGLWRRDDRAAQAGARGPAGALGDRAMAKIRDRVEGAAGRLAQYAQGGGGGPGLIAAVTVARSLAEDKSPLRAGP